MNTEQPTTSTHPGPIVAWCDVCGDPNPEHVTRANRRDVRFACTECHDRQRGGEHIRQQGADE